MTVAVDKKTRRPRPPKQLDPVTQYATYVRDGAIPAGRAVRLAAERHFRDLDRQDTDEFPFVFNVAAAQRVIDFFPTFLTLEDGEPFYLPAWLQFCVGSMYGWQWSRGPRKGLRRFQHGYWETSKGSGKTPCAGGLTLYGAGFDGEPYAQIYTTGFDKGQAQLILDHASRLATTSPDEEFRAEFIVDKYNIAHPASGSFIRAMSSQHRSKSGPRPHYVFSDEIHEQRDGSVVGKAEAGFKNRKQPIGLKLTNSGSDKASFCGELHQKSIGVLEQTQPDEQWFAYVCHLDACEKCFSEGYRQPKDGCQDCDNWLDRKVWPKIAPALGVVIEEKYLQDAIDAALSVPSSFARNRRLNFCFWTQTHQTWIQSEQWEACRSATIVASNEEGRPCAAGLDLSSKIDLSSLVVAVRFDDPPGAPSEMVNIEGLDEETGERVVRALTLNFSIDLIPYFWIPEATLLERVQKERIPYDVWLRGNHLFVTPGPVIDHQAIYQFIVGDRKAGDIGIMKRFKIQKLGYDQHDATMLAVSLRDQGRLGDRLVEVPQGKKLSEVNKLIEMLIRSRRLRHNGNPVLAWNVSNAEAHRDRLGALWIEKPAEVKRIDGLAGAQMAIHQLMILPAKKQKTGTGVFWV